MNSALGKKPPESYTHAETVMEAVHYRTALIESSKVDDAFSEELEKCRDIAERFGMYDRLDALAKGLKKKAKQARISCGVEEDV